MNARRIIAAGFVLALFGLVLPVGCSGPSTGPGYQSGEFDSDYLLAEEPEGAMGVLEIRTDLKETKMAAEIAVVGRIGGVDQQLWDPSRAAFMIVDTAIESDLAEHSGTGHEADDCPFCRAETKKLLDGTALVQVVDENDEVPSVDARKLLGLKEGQTIVVVGQAEIDSLDILVVKARAIHVRD